MIRSVALSLAFLLSMAVTKSSRAEAQGDDTVAAREAFVAGAAAAEEGRWADSLEEFQRAYLLSGVPTALYNAAMALRALGRHREARDAFQRILDEHPDSPAVEQAGPKAEEEAARVAVLTLAGLDPSATYEVRVDGRAVEVAQGESVELETDPGHRGVAAEREGYEPWAWEGEVTDGERRTLEVEMQELEVETRSIAKSPWLWTIIGVVVVGAGVGVGIYLQNRAQLDPMFENNLEV